MPKKTQTENNEEQAKSTAKRKKKITNDTLVNVRNGARGKLVYVSPRSKITWAWANYGDEDVIEVGELLAMKATYPAFFEKNWIIIEDEEIIEHLRLKNFYKKAVRPEEVDDILELPVEELEHLLDSVPDSTKTLIIGIAKDRYDSGDFTNIRKINMLQDKFNVTIVTE